MKIEMIQKYQIPEDEKRTSVSWNGTILHLQQDGYRDELDSVYLDIKAVRELLQFIKEIKLDVKQ